MEPQGLKGRYTMNIQELTDKVKANAITDKSAWSKGVRSYALEMLGNLEDTSAQADKITLGDLINHVGYKFVKIGCFSGSWGACNEVSWGGNFEIYDGDIAERLASPSEIKKCTRVDGSLRNPNNRESWLDVQTRAIYQAILLIQRNARG